jgi:hypothetical protein
VPGSDSIELLTGGFAPIFNSELLTVINSVNNSLLIIRAFFTLP